MPGPKTSRPPRKGALDADILQRVLRAAQRVVVQHCHVGHPARLQRSLDVFFPGDHGAGLTDHAQRFLAGEVALAQRAAGIGIVAGPAPPTSSTAWNRARCPTTAPPERRHPIRARIGIARSPISCRLKRSEAMYMKFGGHGRDYAEFLHTPDLIGGRLDHMDHHPAPVADRDLGVDRLIGPEHAFEVVADQAAQPDAEPGGMNADLDEALVRQRMVEMPGPCLVGVILADDGGRPARWRRRRIRLRDAASRRRCRARRAGSPIRPGSRPACGRRPKRPAR